MQVGVVLISSAMVALSTWGYLATFAASPGSAIGRVFTPLLPFTWVDSRRSNPDGTLETPVGFIDRLSPATPIVEPPVTALALKSPAKIVRSGSRTNVPLPERAVRLFASVPLPERAVRSQNILTAQWLPVRRPEQDLPDPKVADSVEAARMRIIRDVKTASLAGPAVIIVQEVVRQTASQPMIDLVTGSITRRPNFEGRQALGGPRPVEIEPVAIVRDRQIVRSSAQRELPELLPIGMSLNSTPGTFQPAGLATHSLPSPSEFTAPSASPELVQVSLRTDAEHLEPDPTVGDRDVIQAAAPRRRAAAQKVHRPKSPRNYQQRRNRSIANSIRQARRARGVY